jgi:hypothetical protein
MFHRSIAFAEAQNHICVNLRPSAVGFRFFVAFAAVLCNRSVSVFSVTLW